MSLSKMLIFGCCLVITWFVVYFHLWYLDKEKRKAYNEGYNDGMVSISPDYCLKEFSNNSTRKFRYIQRQYCRGIQK